MKKKQSDHKCQRAAQAVTLYFDMHGQDEGISLSTNVPPGFMVLMLDQSLSATVTQRKSQFNDIGYQEKSDSPEWDAVMETMANEIKVRHYSRKTLKTYAIGRGSFSDF